MQISPPYDELSYNASMVGFPVLAFGIILGTMGVNYAWGWLLEWGLKKTWLVFVWLIYAVYILLEVLTKWLNVTPKAAGAEQLDRGATKG